MKTLVQQVGPGLVIPTGMAWAQATASARAKGGQVSDLLVNAAAAMYENDCWAIPQYCQRVVIDGSGPNGAKAHIKNTLAHGMPHVTGVPFQGAVADKGMIVVLGDDVTIRSFEVEGAKTSSGSNNGVAIRLINGTNLTVEDCFLHHNQGGILLTTLDVPGTTSDERGTVNIRRTHFFHNGDHGQVHHIYADDGELLNIEDSLFEEAVNEANCVKTRMDKTILRNTTILALSGLDSYEIDGMAGELVARGVTIKKRSAFSSQPKKCIHLYYEPKSKPMVLDFDGMELDLRDPVAGKPIVIDPRIKHEGTGGTDVGADGKHHPKGENYYVAGEYGPKPQGKIDNITIFVNKDLKHSFGFDGHAARKLLFLVNDPAIPADFLSDIEIGPNIHWVPV
jgi:hypothetical protein